MSSWNCAETMPPMRAMALVHSTSSGMAIASASDLGKDQAQAARHAHRRQRIDLLGDAHHAELRRHRRAGASRHQHRHQHRPQFADDAHAEDVHDEDVGAEILQLQRGQVGQHDADQKADQRGDRHGAHAALVEVGRALAPGHFARGAQDLARCRARAGRPARRNPPDAATSCRLRLPRVTTHSSGCTGSGPVSFSLLAA